MSSSNIEGVDVHSSDARPRRPSLTDLPWTARAALSQSDSATVLGVTRQHVAEMRGRGELRAVMLGRRVVIPTSEIRRLLGETEGGASDAG